MKEEFLQYLATIIFLGALLYDLSYLVSSNYIAYMLELNIIFTS
jgi:hypothetical protein